MKFETVDEYIKSCPKETQKVLKQLRQIIKKIIPKAEQTISYNIPTFKMNGKYVVYFAGFAKHVGIYPVHLAGPGLTKAMAPYRSGKSSLRFPIDKPLPAALIKKVVQGLAKNNSNRTTKQK